jgi:hypothetical protein
MTASRLATLGDGAYAYLQSGGWGFSNAGLITSDGTALLVDTLYDVRLTREMLATMRRATDAASRIEAVVNTHANGDPLALLAEMARFSTDRPTGSRN